MTIKTDIVIVGSGIVGCGTAYNLALKGYSVTVLEKNLSIGDGGSTRNGGGVRQSGRKTEELPIARYSVNELWPNLSSRLGIDTEYCQQGNLRLGKTSKDIEDLEAIVKRSKAQGLDIRMLTGNQAREINPYLSGEVIGASWCPTDGHANPLKVTLGYYMKAKALGVSFITDEEVIQFGMANGSLKYVHTNHHEYECSRVLVCAGYESIQLLSPYSIQLPMTKLVLDVLVTEKKEKMFDQMLGTAGADFYGHQAKNGSFIFGGTAGITEASYSDFTQGIDMKDTCKGVVGYLPSLKDIKVVRSWTGEIDVMSDHMPVISPIDQIPGLTLACGFTGHGFGIGPAVGEMLSEMITERPTTLNMKAFSYKRFHQDVAL